jgi:hypothetical protein
VSWSNVLVAGAPAIASALGHPCSLGLGGGRPQLKLVYPTTLHAVEDRAAWWSLDDLNTEMPDHHHDSTVENLAGSFDVSDELRCFHKEHVPVAEIQKWQLHDDPDAFENIAKIEELRIAIRRGVRLPAIVLVHTPTGPRFGDADNPRYLGAYHLLEGMHRYNAAYQEQESKIYAWVAHIGCCGGPDSDLEAETGAR